MTGGSCLIRPPSKLSKSVGSGHFVTSLFIEEKDPMAGEPYDVIIIGGGLAGLSLAIQLAHSKRKVALFEREKYPFHRVCGEYVSMESWNFLERTGLHLSEMQLPRITELQVSSVTGITLHHSLLPGGFGISRFTLDASLAELAKEKGARI